MKNLSGHAPAILHIATHGFYWTDQEIREGNMDEKLQFLSMYGNLDDADQALTRSGLLFAGANYTLTGKQTSDLHDDGILTAKEISVLDLRGVDMLVLSACQTGLGKVTGDGVFGLQRGFKKAGAGSLLMSLWKVDDKATRQLMTFFYHNLTQGMNKHDAFSKAQHDLRNMDVEDNSRRKNRRAISSRAKRAKKAAAKKVYADPHYWAAFILLDAIPSSFAIR
jgi:CHAT domain-containing protein